MIETLKSAIVNADTRFAVTVTCDNIEVTVTLSNKKNLEPSLDLNNIKQLISEYINTTDNSNFDTVINSIYIRIAQLYQGRDIEIMIYDTVECLTVMKIFKTSINPAI